MARLYNYRLKTGQNVADERVEALIASGDYSFIAGETIQVMDSEGSMFDVPAENAREAIEAGYTYAPFELVEQEKLRHEVSEKPWTAAGLGALRTLSFGTSDLALQEMGFTEDEIRYHRELNPIASTAGELGGIVFPYGPASLAFRGAARGAQKLLGTAAKNLENTKRLKTLGGVMNNSRIIKGAVGGAAEGAAVGTPYAISSQILDDEARWPEFAEHMIAGAGFGGVAGGLIGGISTAITKGPIAWARDRAYYRALDPKKAEWNKVTRHGTYSKGANEFGRKVMELDKKGILKNLNDADDLLQQLDDELLPYYGQRLDDIIDDVSKAATRSGQNLDDVMFDTQKIAKRMYDDIILDKRALWGGKIGDDVIKKRIKNANKAIKSFSKIGKQTFRESEDLKRFYQRELADYRKNPNNFAHYESMANIIREESENALEAIAGKLSNSKGINSETYANFIEAKDVYATLKNLQFFAQGAAARQANNARLPITSYILGAGLGGGVFGAADSVLTGGMGAAATFAATALGRKYLRDNGELLFGRTLRRITDYGGALNLADKSQSTMASGINKILRGGVAAGVKWTNPLPDSPQKTIEDFKQTRDQLNNLKGNPAALYPRFLAMLPEVEGDQSLNENMAQTMAVAVNFMHEKLPKNPTSMSEMMFDYREEVPRFSQILQFMRYKMAVDNPHIVLPLIAQGSLMPEHVEAVQQVYPAIYQAQMKTLVEKVMQKNRNLAPVVRNSLSRFFKSNMNPALNFTNQIQEQYKKAAEEMGGGGGNQIQPPTLETQFQSAMRPG